MALEEYEHSARNMEESFGLAPTALISLYEIYHIYGRQDVDDWRNREYALRFCSADNLAGLTSQTLNRRSLEQKGLKWAGYYYVPIGIQSNSFATASQGLPRPTLVISNKGISSQVASDDYGSMFPVFDSISQYNLYYNDLNNARVVRRRVFAKFLDGENFPHNNNINPWGTRGTQVRGDGITNGSGEVVGNKSEVFEFSKELYFISKKVNETKEKIEYELTTSIDSENVMIPNRTILANHCSWCYRGEGCSYSGPPVATDLDDESFMLNTESGYDDSSGSGLQRLDSKRISSTQRRVRSSGYSAEIGESDWTVSISTWSRGKKYLRGDVVRTPSITSEGFTDGTKTTKLSSSGEIVIQNDITVWVCLIEHTSSNNTSPESKSGHWVADQCSKTIKGCKLRFQNKNNYTNNKSLRFGGFPATFDFDTGGE